MKLVTSILICLSLMTSSAISSARAAGGGSEATPPPSAALAQLEKGATVRVTLGTQTDDSAIGPLTGRLDSVTATSLILKIPGPVTTKREVALADIERVEVESVTHRKTVPGALIGAAVLGGITGLVTVSTLPEESDAPLDFSRMNAAISATIITGFAVVAGAVIGGTWGHSHGDSHWTTVLGSPATHSALQRADQQVQLAYSRRF